MHKVFLFLSICFLLSFPGLVRADGFFDNVRGRILIDVENNGEAWYVNPVNLKRYYLGRPADAFEVMRGLGVGITNQDLLLIPESDNNELSDKQFISGLAGKILLQVENNGEAWYVNPVNLKRYYLGRPADAFEVMRGLGLGIKVDNLNRINKGEILSKSVYHQVPFTPQAPFADWNDPRQQEGCEEASVLMAMKWINGEKLLPEEALREIIAIADFEKKEYGHFHDESAYDTIEMIFKGYFNYNDVELKYDIDVGDIAKELNSGNLIIVPVDGKKLNNPYFTFPGPDKHMVVVTGYDTIKDEFITNDPGTKRGGDYRYDSTILNNALRDYPTGFLLPVKEDRTAMIIVKK